MGLNIFARKGSGSYYTPDDLVRLIIERTVGPLVKERMETFANSAKKVKGKQLEALDPATTILDLKVCDPAMGSGHFLVDLVDYLADAVIDATVAAKEEVEDYTSPLMARIAAIRAQIMEQAIANKWAMKEDQLDDRLIVRRMVLKRVIYGVDKNPMAVELAKVALWLHTFTVGAPLSFLDHHLRCGDSLFGEKVRGVLDTLHSEGGFFIQPAIQRAQASTKGMEQIELNTDADIAGVKSSAAVFATVSEAIGPLSNLMSLLHASKWRGTSDKIDKQSIQAWLAGNFGDPFEIAEGKIEIKPAKTGKLAMKGLAVEEDVVERLRIIFKEAKDLIASEHFLHWEVAFPGVWTDWQSNEPVGGFDAVIGNPPWDRIKFQEVEWFSERKRELSALPTSAARKQEIEKLRISGNPLFDAFSTAAISAATMH